MGDITVSEVATIEEKCESGMSSHQDPSKHELDSVNGEITEHQNGGINEYGEVTEHPNGEENEKVKWSDEFPPLVSMNSGLQVCFSNVMEERWVDVVKTPCKASLRHGDSVHLAVTQWQILTTQLSSKGGNFMELSNKTTKFPRASIRFNKEGNIRRLGTSDDRSPSPDEKPLVPSNYAEERVDEMASTQVKVDLAPQIPNLDLKQETTDENVTLDGKMMKEATKPKNQKVTKGLTATVQANSFEILSSRDFIDEMYEEPVKSREDESIREEEEMTREEAEATLKEQSRLEVLEKANEANERKKRQAEKLQIRAESKTRKEAEQKDKERQKRLRRKERKKATVKNSKKIQVEDISLVAPKRAQSSWLLWVGIASLLIVVLFWRSPLH